MDVMKSKCPYCGFEEEVEESYVGETGECASCHKDYVVGAVYVNDPHGNSPRWEVRCPYCGSLNDLTNEHLNRNVRCWHCNGKFHAIKKAAPVRAASFYDQNKSMFSFSGALLVFGVIGLGLFALCGSMELGVFAFVLSLVCALFAIGLPLAFHLFFKLCGIEYRSHGVKPSAVGKQSLTDAERQYEELVLKIKKINAALHTDFSVGNADTLAEELSRPRKEFMLRLHKLIDEVVGCHGLRPISAAGIDTESGEVVYYRSDGVECLVRRSNEDVQLGTGMLFVTNRRIVFSSDEHRQQYSLKNLRDFSACWYSCIGSVVLGTSDRRKEKFRLKNPWAFTFVVTFLWNAAVRSRILALDYDGLMGFLKERIKSLPPDYCLWVSRRYQLLVKRNSLLIVDLGLINSPMDCLGIFSVEDAKNNISVAFCKEEIDRRLSPDCCSSVSW